MLLQDERTAVGLHYWTRGWGATSCMCSGINSALWWHAGASCLLPSLGFEIIKARPFRTFGAFWHVLLATEQLERLPLHSFFGIQVVEIGTTAAPPPLYKAMLHLSSPPLFGEVQTQHPHHSIVQVPSCRLPPGFTPCSAVHSLSHQCHFAATLHASFQVPTFQWAVWRIQASEMQPGQPGAKQKKLAKASQSAVNEMSIAWQQDTMSKIHMKRSLHVAGGHGP